MTQTAFYGKINQARGDCLIGANTKTYLTFQL